MDLTLNQAEEFDTLAECLLNRQKLIIGGIPYRIHEIEFYLTSPEHRDPYTHCDEEQLTVGRWYFHRKGNSYKGGTFKGLDLTFGGPEGTDIYGGILLRTIARDHAPKVIEGPCNVVDEILRVSGCETIAQFVAKNGTDALHCPDLHLEAADLLNMSIYSCRRIGLSDKDPRWQSAPYRFLIMPRTIKKDRAGIRQGMQQNSGLSDEEIRAILK